MSPLVAQMFAARYGYPPPAITEEVAEMDTWDFGYLTGLLGLVANGENEQYDEGYALGLHHREQIEEGV